MHRLRLGVSSALVLLTVIAAMAQSPARPGAEAEARRVGERIRALQREADRLAGEARTLIGDLRKLEVERDLQVERMREAEAAVAAAQAAIEQTTARLAQLERERMSQLPDLEAQLVDIYKRGRGGYARLLAGAGGVREFARTTRAVAALVRINERRVADHRKTLGAAQQERLALEQKVRNLQASQTDIARARAAAERAVAARTALIAQIDARRDLNAQFAGELQVAYQQLQRQIAAAATGRSLEAVAIPLSPFRGALEWPVPGRVTGRFGEQFGRFGAPVPRNGLEIAAADGASVQAVHSGRVSYADAFSGFGNLVIVDHGDNDYSLYGYLSSIAVKEGDAIENGAVVGRVGSAPAGPSALYFEMRVDGRSVDPVQWLKPR